MLLVASCFAALADVGPANVYTTGSIVVNNAAKGETYYAIKALGATMSGDGIAYEKPLPEQLKTVFEVKTITEDGKTYEAIGAKDTATADDIQAAMRAFANANKPWTGGQEASGNTVTFENLEPGYYVIVSTLKTASQTVDTNKVSAGSTYNPDAAAGSKNVGQVYEKNTTEVTVTKSTDEPYSIGDTITYTVTFNGANYRGTGEAAQIVTKYEVQDTLPEFLKNVTVTGITIGAGEGSEKTVNDENFPGVSTFGTTKKFDIPWATGSDHNYTSMYPNGTQVTITYQAVLTDIVKVGGTAGNVNKVTIVPYVDKPDGPGPSEDDLHDEAKVFTYAAALKKTDGTNLLAGAKFAFNGLTAHVAPGYEKGVYIVDSFIASSNTPGTELEVGADGKLYILGLKQTTDTAITLTGKETVAPAGYNLLTSDVTLTPERTSVEVWSKTEHRYFDAAGNLVASESSSMHDLQQDKDVTENLNVLDAQGVEVVNKKGTQLPSTGGIGTTLFYIGGGILVLAAVILLVTKRRMNAND